MPSLNQLIHTIWRRLRSPVLLLLLAGCRFGAVTSAGQLESAPAAVTNISGMREAIGMWSGRVCAYDLNGLVLAADGNSGVLFFQDDSGVSALEADLKGMKLRPGQRVHLSGMSYVSSTSTGFALGTRPVLDADNLHSVIERSEEVYLKAGRHPIRVTWFNQGGLYSLNVAYSGPNIPKQTISASALFQTARGDALPGLRYRCFEGQWRELPDFSSMTPRKVGTVSYFDQTVKSRVEDVGLEFVGFLEVPKAGNYKFYLSSDDGSQLFLDDTPPLVNVTGFRPVPTARPIAVGQGLAGDQGSLWAEASGTITFVGKYGRDLKFELSADENRMQVEVLGAPDGIPWYLLNSRVTVRGLCLDSKNVRGQRYAWKIVAADWRDVRVLDVARGQWEAFGDTTVGELNRETGATTNGVACLHGHIGTNLLTQKMQFEDATGVAPIDLLTGIPGDTNTDMECLSQWSFRGTNLTLHEAVVRLIAKTLAGTSNSLPLLTTAVQVQQLTREEAAREYPVEIQGIVTSVSLDFRSFLIQDSTRAVFVWVGDTIPADLPHEGDFCKVEGHSQPLDFSPAIIFRKATVLWQGLMPQPIIPNRDQLLSGSLDAQYVEIRGLVIAAEDTGVTLLTANGILDLDFSPPPREHWNEFLNSIIRVRGCLVANWDPKTHHVILDPPVRLHIRGASVCIESPPPTNLFAADPVRAAELMQYDERFDTFRRVKIRGQIIHSDANNFYLMDGATGLRFRLAQPAPLYPGDEVEVVGLVDFGESSLLLRQAVASKIKHLPPPEPRKLSLNSLSNNYDSTLVSVEGTLVDIQNRGSKLALEIQVGVRSFVARFDSQKPPADLWAVGSRLRLTGTFCALDGDRLAGRDVNSFELLMNSPQDVEVIARPPWWTLPRLLMAITCLLAGLALAFVWIALLRHQVERRTRQLGREITERERAEKLRAIEHERSRIARDLHDDLGSTLTEIGMMAANNPGLKIGSETAINRLHEIAEKSRSMVSALDSVVWVVNSKNDTLSCLIEYLASYAEEFLANSQVGCRIELPRDYLERMIPAEIRHDVVLAVREALSNAVRHGRPKVVLLRQAVAKDSLKILIQDDGCGFNPGQTRGNGLGNLEQRMGKLNAVVQIQSPPEGGTTVVLEIPLPQ